MGHLLLLQSWLQIQNFLRFEGQEIKRSKRLSYVNEPPNARCESSSEAPRIAGFLLQN